MSAERGGSWMVLPLLAAMAGTGVLAVRVLLDNDKKQTAEHFIPPKPAQETALQQEQEPSPAELPPARRLDLPAPQDGKGMTALPSVAPETRLDLYSRPPAAAGGAAPGRTAAGPGAGSRPGLAPAPAQPAWDGRKKSRTPAESFYFSLLHRPQYKSSPAIQAWKKEFLSSPDLLAINHTYHQTGDAFRFLNDVAKSPSFQRMLGRYLGTSDVQGFLTEMAGSPSVKASAGQYMAASADLRRMGQAMGYALPQGAPTLPRR